MSSPGIRWCVDDIADAIAEGLIRRVEADRAAQSVRGIDALDEVALHPELADALRDAGFRVHREQRTRLGTDEAEKLTPMQALRRYFQSRNIPDDRERVLLEHAEQLMRQELEDEDA